MTINCSPSYFRITAICKCRSPASPGQRYLHNERFTLEIKRPLVSSPPSQTKACSTPSFIQVVWCHQATDQSHLLAMAILLPKLTPTYQNSLQQKQTSVLLLWIASQLPLNCSEPLSTSTSSSEHSHNPIACQGLSFRFHHFTRCCPFEIFKPPGSTLQGTVQSLCHLGLSTFNL